MVINRPFTRTQFFSYGMKKLNLSLGFITELSHQISSVLTVFSLFLEEKWQKPYSKDILIHL